MIAWHQFSWEAFSSLATGIMAVIAAYIIGIRQAKISEGQRQILGRQVELDELKLRSELFSRRFVTYEATLRFLVTCLNGNTEVDGQNIETTFLKELDQAKFLFNETTSNFIREIWAEVNKHRALKSVTQHSFDTTGSYGDQLQSEHASQNRLISLLDQMSGVFGEEMNLRMRQ